jgi:hypothetical protein
MDVLSPAKDADSTVAVTLLASLPFPATRIRDRAPTFD